jgi:hypothetical protein
LLLLFVIMIKLLAPYSRWQARVQG